MALPTKEGYLNKYRNKIVGWDNRYFKLDRSYFHYYDAKDSPSPRKTALRTDIASVSECTSFPDKSNVLEVSLKGLEKWHIQCGSEFELKEWARVLLAHIPDNDKRKEWLAAKYVGSPEMQVQVPQMPQYMLHGVNEEPPSYRTVTHPYHAQGGAQPMPPYNYQPHPRPDEKIVTKPSAPYQP